MKGSHAVPVLLQSQAQGAGLAWAQGSQVCSVPDPPEASLGPKVCGLDQDGPLGTLVGVCNWTN